MIAVTTATVADVPALRVLARSWSQHHDGRLRAVVVDAEPGRLGADEPFEVVDAGALGLPAEEVAARRLLYPPRGLAASLKAAALAAALADSGGPVVYLAPGTSVRRPLDALAAAAAGSAAGTALVPTLSSPLPDDGRRPGPLDARRHGPVDANLLAVAPGAEALLAWWDAHLRRDCVDEPHNGMHLDAGWLDLAVGAFPVALVPHLVGSVWTLHAGTVEELDPAVILLDDLDPERPWLLSPDHAGLSPRLLLSDRPDLRRLVDDRIQALAGAAGDPTEVAAAPTPALDDGTPIDARMRHLFRVACKRADAGQGPPPPTPFGPGAAAAVIEWLRAPDPTGRSRQVGRYLEQIYVERPDVQAGLPTLDGVNAQVFLNWCVEHGQAECAIPAPLVPTFAAPVVPPRRLDVPGLNVAGYFRSILGLGEAARSLVEAISTARIPHSLVTNDDTLSAAGYEVDDVTADRAGHDVNLLCVTADRTPAFARSVGPAFFEGRHTIGLWYWETDVLTDDMRQALEVVDEIWVTSSYGADLFRPHTTKPVIELPVPVPRPVVADDITRADLGLPEDRFVFLFTFDFLSTSVRKNPDGLIEAFSRAFAPGEGPVLVIKSTNADQRLLEAERMRRAAADRPDIVLIDRYARPEEQVAYLARADCYASLHRSEGFGLGMAQAMALGKPVLATGYSGNLAFMDDANSFLVPATLTEVGPGSAPYPPDGRWGDPDLDEAARLLRHIWEHPDDAAARGQRAAADLAARWSVEASAQAIAARWRTLRAELTDKPPAPRGGGSPSSSERLGRLANRVKDARFPRRR